MLTLEAHRRSLRGVPPVVRFGLATMAFALLVDVIAHLEASPVHAGQAHQHTSTELWAHFGVFVGMVLVITGVLIDGARKQRDRRDPAERRTKGVA